jgi:ABC-type Mn2+/Zn2+ transport system permease subunit
VTFGFLVVPPLAARRLTRRMLSFSIVAALIGGLAAFVGFYCAYRFDLPLGPAEVAVACLALFATAGVRRRGALATG